MKYSATVQFKDTRAQWTLTTVPREDGKGFTMYGLEADSFDDAIAKTRELFRVKQAETEAVDDDFGDLVSGEPESIILMQKEPHEVRTVPW